MGLVGVVPPHNAVRRGGRRCRAPFPSLCSDLSALEAQVEALRRHCGTLEQRLSVLERVAPAEFSVFHYNVLADQYASNLQPWFLYGAEPCVSEAERVALTERFYQRDKLGAFVNRGWPSWAPDRLLSPPRRAAIESLDADVFAWRKRSARLWAEVSRADCDVVTLAECDHYADFWEPRLRGAGYESIWRKRPRGSSADGCTIGWRAATFELVAEGGVDFADSIEKQAKGQLDRTFLVSLLRFRRNPSQRLLVATTHLARNPEKKSQTLPRSFQYSLLFRELLTFATAHDAVQAPLAPQPPLAPLAPKDSSSHIWQVPVVLTGDLNAQCVDELSGIAKGIAVMMGGFDKVHPSHIWQALPTQPFPYMAGAPRPHGPSHIWQVHPGLTALLDVPTGPTTKTDAREMRIDYVLYQTSKLVLRAVSPVPLLSSPIPNAEHPSDHTPICATFQFRSSYAQLEENARTWLNVVARPGSSARPLLPNELRSAFSFFDKDGSGIVSPVELDAAMALLNYPTASASAIREAVARVPGSGPVTDHLGYADFCLAFAYFISGVDSGSASCRSDIPLRIAFGSFDDDGDGMLTVAEFREAVARILPGPVLEEV